MLPLGKVHPEQLNDGPTAVHLMEADTVHAAHREACSLLLSLVPFLTGF